MRRASPLRNSGCVVTERSVVHLVDEDAEESGGLFVLIRLKLRMNLDDEGRSRCEEQTGLPCESASISKREYNTHKY